jgi:hypothetical protein
MGVRRSSRVAAAGRNGREGRRVVRQSRNPKRLELTRDTIRELERQGADPQLIELARRRLEHRHAAAG